MKEELQAMIRDDTLWVRVTPKASRNRIVIEAGEAGEVGRVRVYVTTPPEDGKANAAVQKLVAKALGLAKSQLTLQRGQTSRDKLFRIG